MGIPHLSAAHSHGGQSGYAGHGPEQTGAKSGGFPRKSPCRKAGKAAAKAAAPCYAMPQYLQNCSRMEVISSTISSTFKTISIMLTCSS